MEDSEIVALYWARSPDAIEMTAGKYGGYCKTVAQNIVGSAEGSGSDTEIKNVTNDSPIGKALLDHRVGDEVDVHTPKGVFQAKILEVHLH